jgi:hypothetical protein
VYFSDSTDGGASFAPNTKVTTTMSDESSANPFADAGNQYGDYEGIAAYGGTARPIWTDSRLAATVDPATGQPLQEEIFSASVSAK